MIALSSLQTTSGCPSAWPQESPRTSATPRTKAGMLTAPRTMAVDTSTPTSAPTSPSTPRRRRRKAIRSLWACLSFPRASARPCSPAPPLSCAPPRPLPEARDISLPLLPFPCNFCPLRSLPGSGIASEGLGRPESKKGVRLGARGGRAVVHTSTRIAHRIGPKESLAYASEFRVGVDVHCLGFGKGYHVPLPCGRDTGEARTANARSHARRLRAMRFRGRGTDNGADRNPRSGSVDVKSACYSYILIPQARLLFAYGEKEKTDRLKTASGPPSVFANAISGPDACGCWIFGSKKARGLRSSVGGCMW